MVVPPLLFLTIVLTAVGQQVRCERVGKQAGTVVEFSAFGRLLAKLAGVIRVLCINARFGPVNTSIRVQPVIVRRGERVGQLRIALDG